MAKRGRPKKKSFNELLREKMARLADEAIERQMPKPVAEPSLDSKDPLQRKKARDKDGDAYQTVLHKLTIKVEYSVRDSSGKVVLKGKVAGQASVPLMHDREVALLSARKLAVKDAARQIADALADNH